MTPRPPDAEWQVQLRDFLGFTRRTKTNEANENGTLAIKTLRETKSVRNEKTDPGTDGEDQGLRHDPY